MALAKDATIIHIPREVRRKLKQLAAQQDKPMYAVLEDWLNSLDVQHAPTSHQQETPADE